MEPAAPVQRLALPDRPAGRPVISVVIPALDEERTLADCLTSLLAQDIEVPIEIIVVDNGSTDGTRELAQRFGVRVIEEPRRGVCQARQRGTAEARGEFVVSTDADTVLPPTWLRRIHAVLSAGDGVVAVCGPCRFADGPWWARPYTTLLFGVVSIVHRLTGRVLYATATNIAFRRDAWPGYDLSLTQGGDELALIRALRRAGRVVFDARNLVATSSRRLYRGLLYSLFVTCLYHYLLTYLVNRVAGRPVLGMAPLVRLDRESDRATRRAERRTGLLIALLVLSVALYWATPIDVDLG